MPGTKTRHKTKAEQLREIIMLNRRQAEQVDPRSLPHHLGPGHVQRSNERTIQRSPFQAIRGLGQQGPPQQGPSQDGQLMVPPDGAAGAGAGALLDTSARRFGLPSPEAPAASSAPPSASDLPARLAAARHGGAPANDSFPALPSSADVTLTTGRLAAHADNPLVIKWSTGETGKGEHWRKMGSEADAKALSAQLDAAGFSTGVNGRWVALIAPSAPEAQPNPFDTNPATGLPFRDGLASDNLRRFRGEQGRDPQTGTISGRTAPAFISAAGHEKERAASLFRNYFSGAGDSDIIQGLTDAYMRRYGRPPPPDVLNRMFRRLFQGVR